MRSAYVSAVTDCVSQIYRARGNSEWPWQGDAGENFKAKMSTGGAKGDELAANADAAAQAFENHAGDLQTGQIGMGRAREIAVGGGLEVVGDDILPPGPAPTGPAALRADATPQAVQAYNEGVAAQQVHAQKVAAYQAAAEEADRARGIVDGSKNVTRAVLNEFRSKAVFHAADLANITVGALAAKHTSILMKHADELGRVLRITGRGRGARF